MLCLFQLNRIDGDCLGRNQMAAPGAVPTQRNDCTPSSAAGAHIHMHGLLQQQRLSRRLPSLRPPPQTRVRAQVHSSGRHGGCPGSGRRRRPGRGPKSTAAAVTEAALAQAAAADLGEGPSPQQRPSRRLPWLRPPPQTGARAQVHSSGRHGGCPGSGRRRRPGREPKSTAAAVTEAALAQAAAADRGASPSPQQRPSRRLPWLRPPPQTGARAQVHSSGRHGGCPGSGRRRRPGREPKSTAAAVTEAALAQAAAADRGASPSPQQRPSRRLPWLRPPPQTGARAQVHSSGRHGGCPGSGRRRRPGREPKSTAAAVTEAALAQAAAADRGASPSPQQRPSRRLPWLRPPPQTGARAQVHSSGRHGGCPGSGRRRRPGREPKSTAAAVTEAALAQAAAADRGASPSPQQRPSRRLPWLRPPPQTGARAQVHSSGRHGGCPGSGRRRRPGREPKSTAAAATEAALAQAAAADRGASPSPQQRPPRRLPWLRPPPQTGARAQVHSSGRHGGCPGSGRRRRPGREPKSTAAAATEAALAQAAAADRGASPSPQQRPPRRLPWLRPPPQTGARAQVHSSGRHGGCPGSGRRRRPGRRPQVHSSGCHGGCPGSGRRRRPGRRPQVHSSSCHETTPHKPFHPPHPDLSGLTIAPPATS